MYFSVIFFSVFYLLANSLELNHTSIIKSTSPTSVAIAVKTGTIENSTDVPKPLLTASDKKTIDPILKVNQFSFMTKISVIGNSCNKTDDCHVQNSTCFKGVCQCDTNFVVSNSNNRTCLKKAKTLYDDCSENVQCDSIFNSSGLTVCLSFQCLCSPNAVKVGDKCFKRSVLGNQCKIDEECSIPYSYCFQGVCACDPEYSPDENGTHCYPNGFTNGTTLDCKESSNICLVLGRDSHCVNGTCTCFPGYHLSSRKCVPEKRLDGKCISNDDCIVDMAPKEPVGVRICKEGKCSCIKGYKPLIDNNICKSGSTTIRHSILLLAGSLFIFFSKTK